MSIRRLVRSQHGIIPIPVLWALIVLAFCAVVGISAYLLSQTVMAILGVITLVIVFVYILVPALPTIVRKVKEAVKEAHRKEAKENEQSENKPR